MKTIEESNRMIAVFMGIDQVDVDTYIETSSELKYHTSWDWLMPVVEKIASEYHKTEIVSDEESDYCKITVYIDTEYSHEIFECGLSTKEATYEAVVQFIEWYNRLTDET